MDRPVPRPARAGEADAIARLVRDAYRPWIARIGREPGPMGDDYAGRVAAGEAWVIEDAQGLAGVLVLEDAPDHLLLDNVAVAPARRGQGIGRILIGFAEAEARRRGHREIRLYTHVRMVENQRLYARLGYVETHRAAQSGFARVFMTKRL